MTHTGETEMDNHAGRIAYQFHNKIVLPPIWDSMIDIWLYVN